MNTPEDRIEQLLHRAPQPRPGPGLRPAIVRGIALPHPAADGPAAPVAGKSWLQRWWPAFATGGVAAATFAMAMVQQSQIRQLEAELETVRHTLRPSAAPASPASPASPAAAPQEATVPHTDGAIELESLRARVREMTAEVTSLEGLRAENTRLRAEAATNLGIPPEALEELMQAKEKAQRIVCVNNLKQLGLAARVWAVDNSDLLPPDILSMSNELATPKILVCPSDTGRQVAADWSSFSPANISYEFLAAGGSDTEPQRVAFRCPVHGNLGLVDGSVQMSMAKDHPEWLVQREGKLMLEVPRREDPAQPPGEAQPAPQMDPRLMERYGLKPQAPGTSPAAPPAGQGMSDEMMRRYGLQPPSNPPDPDPAEPDAAEPGSDPQ